eukprot:9417-Heterococcus_DN1.PRE.1
MASTSREEEALAALSNPLRYDGILQQVFAFIPGNWLFLSAVCSEWRAIYANIGEQQVTRRLHFLHLINEQLCGPVPDELDSFVARSGSINMLKWLKAQKLSTLCWYACEGAAEGGQLAVLQYLRSEEYDWSGSSVMCRAARSGSIAMVEWLQQYEGVEIDPRAMAAAASEGQTAMCEYLLNIGCYWTDAAPTKAAEAGHFETLRWLRKKGCPWNVPASFWQAVYSSCTDVLNFVIEQGEVLDAQLLSCALRDATLRNNLQLLSVTSAVLSTYYTKMYCCSSAIRGGCGDRVFRQNKIAHEYVGRECYHHHSPMKERQNCMNVYTVLLMHIAYSRIISRNSTKS